VNCSSTVAVGPDERPCRSATYSFFRIIFQMSRSRLLSIEMFIVGTHPVGLLIALPAQLTGGGVSCQSLC